jgi:lysophospholipase L1-like esterase
MAQGFALHDGDTVVFYGDSITALRLYTKFVEDAVLTRYPKLHVTFINAGVPGDTVYGGYAGAMADRVQHDVAPFHPAIITIMLGMNDGGYGYTPTPVVHANFLKGYNALLDALQKAAPDAKLILLNPTPYDEITHGTEFPGYSTLVDQLSDDVTKIATARPNVSRVDLHAPVVAALTHANSQFPQLAPLLIPDRIHPGEATQWIMASALLSAWHIDPVVSRVTLNAKTAAVVATQRTAITKLATTSSGLQWTQLDTSLPLPLDLNDAMTKVLLGVSDIASIDQQTLRVDGLAKGSYQLFIDTKSIAVFSSDDLQHGINLALQKTPMLDQARGVEWQEQRRSMLDQARFILRAEVKVTETTPAAEDKLQQAEDEVAATIRTKLAPTPHVFELRLRPTK